MKWIFGWGIVFVLSFGLGAILCGITLWRKNYKATMIAALIFFGLPVIGVTVDLIHQEWILYKFERAKKEVARLCAKDGGDKIYRTVENVQGVFQMRARLPDHSRKPDGTYYEATSDQYGMEDPYGWAHGDRADLSGLIGRSITSQGISKGEHGYWFIEQHPGQGSSKGSGFRRSYLAVVKNPPEWRSRANEGNPVYEVKQITNVSDMLSRYGYLTEDLTTKAMRDNWIGAGRIKIVDLETNELLAERKGYFRAAGDLLPSSAIRWSSSYSCPDNDASLGHFLHSVLKPVGGFPSTEQLETIAKE